MNKIYLCLDGNTPCIIIQRAGGEIFKMYQHGPINSLSGDPSNYVTDIIAEFTAEEFVNSCVEGYLEGMGKTLNEFNYDNIPF